MYFFFIYFFLLLTFGITVCEKVEPEMVTRFNRLVNCVCLKCLSGNLQDILHSVSLAILKDSQFKSFLHCSLLQLMQKVLRLWATFRLQQA